MHTVLLGPLHRPRSETEDANHEGQRRDKEAGVEHAKAHLGVRVRVRGRVATRDKEAGVEYSMPRPIGIRRSAWRAVWR